MTTPVSESTVTPSGAPSPSSNRTPSGASTPFSGLPCSWNLAAPDLVAPSAGASYLGSTSSAVRTSGCATFRLNFGTDERSTHLPIDPIGCPYQPANELIFSEPSSNLMSPFDRRLSAGIDPTNTGSFMFSGRCWRFPTCGLPETTISCSNVHTYFLRF